MNANYYDCKIACQKHENKNKKKKNFSTHTDLIIVIIMILNFFIIILTVGSEFYCMHNSYRKIRFKMKNCRSEKREKFFF